MILTTSFSLVLLTSLIYSGAGGAISFGKKSLPNLVLRKRDVGPLSQDQANNYSVKNGLSLSFDLPDAVVTLPDGTFNHQAHLDTARRLIAREAANDQRQIEGEITYQNQPHDIKIQLRKRQNDHERRASSFISLNADINYEMQLYTTLLLGTPAQSIRFIIDVTVAHTLVPKACFETPILKKRDGNAGTCPVNTFGFEVMRSTSAAIVPGVFYDTDYSTGAVRLSKRSLSGFPVQLIKEVVAIGSAVLPITFWLFGRRNNARLQPRIPIAPIVAPLVAPAVGILGLAAPGLVAQGPLVPEQVGAVLMQYFGTISEVTQNHHDWVTFSLIQDLVDPLPGGGRKRSIATVSSQVAFGPVDPRRCAPVKVLFNVVGTTGFTQSLLWQLTLQSVQVGPATEYSTSSNIQVTPLGVQAGVSVISSLSIIQYDPSQPFIFLSPATVDSIYAKILNSRKPTLRNPYYSYYCRSSPSINFEFIDTSGTSQLLTMRQQDWYQGLSYDSLGYCNGAIQSLPIGASLQTMGISFAKSFCTSLGTDVATKQADIVAFALPLQLSS